MIKKYLQGDFSSNQDGNKNNMQKIGLQSVMSQNNSNKFQEKIINLMKNSKNIRK